MPRPLLNPYEPKARYIPKHKKHEESVQRQVCSYLRIQYPHVIFRSDYASGLHLTVNQARIHASLQSGRAWPDLFIYHPMKIEGVQYAGMALELKKDGTTIKLKTGPNKGHLVANPHIQEQYYMLQALQKAGYWADFGIGVDDSIDKIDYYMGKPENIGLVF
jgi:hypothetical protein